jgi:molecular chaperone GrpE
MTEHKKHKHQHEEVEETEPQVVAESDTAQQLSAEIEALKKKLEETETKANEFRDSWMRSQAEFQNYKKRLDRDNELKYVSMKGDIVKKVLPVLDDLERALQNRPADNAWANGIELIARKLQNVLDSEGIKRIEAEGLEFDPNFHEAISHEPADGVKSGFVIAVVQNGYILGERVIRPALVRVAQ